MKVWDIFLKNFYIWLKKTKCVQRKLILCWYIDEFLHAPYEFY